MGNRMSRIALGCFSSERHEKYAHGLHFSEPLDEGLGHSFCYVRPVLGSLAYSPNHEDSRDISPPALDLPLETASADAVEMDPQMRAASDELPNLEKMELELKQVDRPRVVWEKPERSKHNERAKSMTETSFKTISGASVSANTSTPRSVASQEQFNSFSNVPIERAAAFESTSSFSALPLQRIANSGPISGPLSGLLGAGPLDRGLQSGPLERGFMSGPLERGFMSGPIERGFMSGPLEPVDRNTFSAPLAGLHGPTRKKNSLKRFVRSMSLPMRKAIARTVSKTTATLTRTIVIPVRHFVLGDNPRDGDHRDFPQSSLDSPLNLGTSGSDLEIKDDNNLQWAQGKAGEDRVHVVLSEEHGWLFVGIYDGFNGPDAPDFLMSNLYPAIYRELKGLLWNQKSGFELGDSSPGDYGGGSTLGLRNIRRSGEEGRAGGDFIARLRRVDSSSCVSLQESQKECASNMQFGVKELSSSGTSGIEGNGKEDLDRNSCQPHSLLETPLVKPAVVSVDLSPGDIGNELGYSSCEVDIAVTHGNGEHSEEQLLKHTEGHVKCELSTSESKCELGLGLEQEGILVEDRVDTQVGTEQNLSSIAPQVKTPESIGSSNVHLAENNLAKDHSFLNMKLQVLHNRRWEQHRKYPQWRYEWEQERLVEEERLKEKLRLMQVEKESENNTVDHDAVLKALSRALEATEEAYLDMTYRVLDENPELALMGSCVLVMLMKDEDVYILNVGDSRAIIAQDCRRGSFNSLSKLSRNQLNGYNVDEHERIGARDSLLRQELERIIEETPTEIEALEAHDPNLGPPPLGLSLLGALQLTEDHSTSTEEEVQRLRAEHPFDDDIISNDRVKGRLKVTRAFGAGFLKQPRLNNVLFEMFRCKFIGNDPYISCDPCLRHHKLGPQDRFLVLSSDGLYQYLSNEEVVSRVEWFMERCPDGDPAQRLIEELLFRAAKKNGMELNELLDIPQGDRRKYHDDVSVMVISLEGRIWRSSGSLKHSA
nr:hypothetical protein PHYPA_011180 [Physcomitrium patens]